MSAPTLQEFTAYIDANPKDIATYIPSVIDTILGSYEDEKEGKEVVEQYREELRSRLFVAKRGKAFKDEIISLLKRGKMKDDCIEKITTKKCMLEYELAFTHRSFDEEKNSEFYEFLGDKIANACISQYLVDTYPQFHTQFGVKILTRLEINYKSWKSFSNFNKLTRMYDFISSNLDVKYYDKEQIIKSKEDVFEAFFGCTSLLIDANIQKGLGFIVCFNIIKSLFDEINVPLKYSTLFDPITRLKEIHDFYRSALGVFGKKKERVTKVKGINIVSYLAPDGSILGQGRDPILKNAEQLAAIEAIKTLRDLGYVKEIDPMYERYGIEIDL